MDASLADPAPECAACPTALALVGDGPPLPLGPFLVERDGTLHAQGVPQLRFDWRGRCVAARVVEGRLALSAAAGAVPYTADRPFERAGALAAIGALPAELPPGWRLRVTPDHRLRLETERLLAEPTTATALVGAMVGFALALDPYLDRLESAGVEAGMVKTWPG